MASSITVRSRLSSATTRRRLIAPLGLLAALLSVTSCSHVPDLIPNVSYVRDVDQITRATLIALGTVENERIVRKLNAGTSELPYPLALFEVKVRLEGIIQGHYPQERLTFYYYQVLGGWTGHEPNFITPGERDVFYLVKDRDVWRATTDAFSSHTRIVTGRYTVTPASSKEEARNTIAQLLLVPGEGFVLPEFLGSLRRNSGVSESLVGKAETSRLLRTLLLNPKPLVRVRACIALAEFPLSEKACLPEIMHEAEASSDDRRRAKELLGQE